MKNIFELKKKITKTVVFLFKHKIEYKFERFLNSCMNYYIENLVCNCQALAIKIEDYIFNYTK